MKFKMNITRSMFVYGFLLFISGGILGWIIFGTSKPISTKQLTGLDEIAKTEPSTWTCSMHTQIRQDKEGLCPICGMELIPLQDEDMGAWTTAPDEIPMTTEAMKLADIQTSVVRLEKPVKEIHLLGKVMADERNISALTARFGGRIENLHINFTGQKVEKGQKLASIYSPDLITAQKELFEAIKYKEDNIAFYKAAKNKLKLWDLTDEQIVNIEREGEILYYFDVLSPISGIVTQRHVSLGEYIKEGSELFEVTDLSRVWVMFESYESDIPWLKIGDDIIFTVQSYPGIEYKESIDFIDPFITPVERVAYVRVELTNSNYRLKPEMFVNGIVSARLPVSKPVILIPKSAVLWTGKKAIIYVKTPLIERNSFQYREITLGEDAGQFYVVSKGLSEGEVIATNGVFRIDAAAQLAGKKSMMNPTGGKVATGHKHGDDDNKDMDMKPMIDIDKSTVSYDFRKQLGGVIVAYLSLTKKLTNDNTDIQSDVEMIQKSLTKVDMYLVMGDAHNVWMKNLKSLNNDLELLMETENIDEIRNIFLTISQSLIDAVHQLGVEMNGKQKLYLVFCSMANNNVGGYWLSIEEKIRNPYFGQKMLGCGEIKELLNK